MIKVVKKRNVSCDYRLLVNGKAQDKFKRDYPKVPIYTTFLDRGSGLTNVPNNDKVAAYVIGIRKEPYHAVAAFRFGKYLFCFDAHGKSSKRVTVFVLLAKKLGIEIKNIYFYRGLPLQTEGQVCVGYSINFLAKMADHFSKTNRVPNKNQYNQAIYNTMSKNNKNIFPQYSLNKSLKSRMTPTKINIITPETRKRKTRNRNATPMNINDMESVMINFQRNGEPMILNTTPRSKRLRLSDVNMNSIKQQLF